MYLYHYFDKRTGPFKSLTALPQDKAADLMQKIKAERPQSFGAQRSSDYLTKRLATEQTVRSEFIKKGGIAELTTPHYMVVEHSPFLCSWFEQSELLKIDINEFDIRKISFTYGDSMPTFSPLVTDGKEYRRQVYTYDEILKIIDEYGLPQDWNDDGAHGPERYIEAHVWTDDPIAGYREKWSESLI